MKYLIYKTYGVQDIIYMNENHVHNTACFVALCDTEEEAEQIRSFGCYVQKVKKVWKIAEHIL